MDTALVRFQLERGRLFNSSGRKEQARHFFVEAYRRARKARLDFHAVDAAHMMGIVEKGEEALQWNETALEVAEGSRDERARNWAGSLYNNIGWTYHDMGRYGDALHMFEKALDFRREAGDEEEIAVARWCVARCLRSLGRVEEALAVHRELCRRTDELGEPDGYVYEELGECLLELGLTDEAAPWFRLAHEELSKDPWLTANEPERLQRLAELGGR
jgi:tetratricopeptide (TPR) repeat protein